MSNWTFTSESVTEGHPDKMADQISDSVLDAILAEDPTARVACETMVTTGLCIVAGEISTKAYVDIPTIARETIKGIGYDRESFGYDGNTCGVMVALDEQSPDIAQGVDDSEEVRSGTAGEEDALRLAVAMERLSTVALTPVREVSTSGASPCTVTSADCAAMWKWSGSVMRAPTSSSIASNASAANPSHSASTRYVPTGSAGNRNT